MGVWNACPTQGEASFLLFGCIAAILVVVLGTVAFDPLGVANTLQGGFPLKLTAYVQIVSALASALLTFVLVVLYREQTRIQQRQKTWMEASHVPDLSVQRWRLDQNRATVMVENLETGLARNVEIAIHVQPSPEDGDSRSTESISYVGRSRIGQSGTFASIVRTDDDQTVLSGTVHSLSCHKPKQKQTETVLEEIDTEQEVSVSVKPLYEHIRQHTQEEFVFE